MAEFTLKLDSPITDEQWDAIIDVDFDSTDRIFFSTKHGKEVEFIKVVRCRECEHGEYDDAIEDEYCYHCRYDGFSYNKADHFCSDGERKGRDET